MKDKRRIEGGGERWKEVERGEEDVIMHIEGQGEGMREVGGIARLL